MLLYIVTGRSQEIVIKISQLHRKEGWPDTRIEFRGAKQRDLYNCRISP